MLHIVTIVINFMGLIISLWLGLYLVTWRSDRLEAWLSALGLWSMGGYFLNHLLALLPPVLPAPEFRGWLYHIILFWPPNIFELGWKGWLLGWLPAYGIAFWYHASLYVLPGRFTRYRIFGAVAGYAVVLADILFNSQYYNAWLSQFNDPLYNPSLPLNIFPLYAIVFVLFSGLIFYNLLRAARSSPASMRQSQFWLLISALILVGANGLVGIVSTLVNSLLPQVITAFVLLVAILLAGIGIVSYIASPGARSIWHELRYNAIQSAVILGISLLLVWVITASHPVQPIFFTLVGCLAILLNYVINYARLRFTRIYSPINTDKISLQNPDQPILIEAKENEKPTIYIEERSFDHESNQPTMTKDVSVRTVELALRNLHDYAYLADSPLSSLHQVTQRIKFMGKGKATYIETGRAVSDVLCEAILRLKPSQEDMPTPTPRTWYPYVILWDAYVENKPNLMIMTQLYISEGTFNRTRKAAINSVARLLLEMQVHAK